MDRVLITGGGGFIGSHLARSLVKHGHDVRVLDDLTPQVHGRSGERPPYLHPGVEFVRGNVCDPGAVRRAVRDADAVVHLAAAVGVGQSMYEVVHYTRVNNLGTAVLMEALADAPASKLVVASSMSVYGEGLYRRRDGRVVEGRARDPQQLSRHEWELLHPTSGEPLAPLPTPETKTPDLASVYALGKFDQERMCLILGNAYGVPTTALRFFNVYGPHQALGNPYTGVLAIFASRILNGKPPVLFEDGEQRRDFVSVHDVAEACRLALTRPEAAGGVFNVGSGESRTVREVAEALLRILDRDDFEPEVAGKYRQGDIRHCFADVSRAREVLGYRPRVTFDAGLRELAEWLRGAEAEDRFDEMQSELSKRRLVS